LATWHNDSGIFDQKNGLLASVHDVTTFEGAHFIASAPVRRKP